MDLRPTRICDLQQGTTGAPLDLPGPRPHGLRSDFGLARPSLDGGFEKFFECIPGAA